MVETPKIISKLLSNTDVSQVNLVTFLLIKLDINKIRSRVYLNASSLKFNTCHVISFDKNFDKKIGIPSTTLCIYL